jgi:hypothetical protein
MFTMTLRVRVCAWPVGRPSLDKALNPAR